MEKQINNYKALINLSDRYLSATNNMMFLQQLMWIEQMLDRAKIEIAELASTNEEKESSRAFTKEIYQYLDTILRPKTTELIQKLSKDQKEYCVNSVKNSAASHIQWIMAS